MALLAANKVTQSLRTSSHTVLHEFFLICSRTSTLPCQPVLPVQPNNTVLIPITSSLYVFPSYASTNVILIFDVVGTLLITELLNRPLLNRRGIKALSFLSITKPVRPRGQRESERHRTKESHDERKCRSTRGTLTTLSMTATAKKNATN